MGLWSYIKQKRAESLAKPRPHLEKRVQEIERKKKVKREQELAYKEAYEKAYHKARLKAARQSGYRKGLATGKGGGNIFDRLGRIGAVASEGIKAGEDFLDIGKVEAPDIWGVGSLSKSRKKRKKRKKSRR